jgi:hypothetical protein
VKRLLPFILVFVLVLTSTGCGNIFVRGAIQPGFSTVTGSVSSIQLGSGIANDGSTVQVTFVTFFFEGTSSTIGFCGDQVSQFPFNQMVRTQFTSGQPCAALIVVIII